MSSWRAFEFDIGGLVQALGYAGEVTPGSSDFGVDVLGRKEGRIVAIQCKLYQGSVGCEPIQRLLAAERLHGATDFMCITTGRYTKKAKELGARTGVILIDGNGLEKACRSHRLALSSCSYLLGDDGSEYVIQDSVVGRDPDCEISLLHPMISRRHASFRFSGLRLNLSDLGSTNGSRVNSLRLPSHKAVQVTYGDRIEFATVGFTLRIRPDC